MWKVFVGKKEVFNPAVKTFFYVLFPFVVPIDLILKSLGFRGMIVYGLKNEQDSELLAMLGFICLLLLALLAIFSIPVFLLEWK